MKPVVKVKCENCGTEFDYRKSKKFCCGSCRAEYFFKQKGKAENEEIVKKVEAENKTLSGTVQKVEAENKTLSGIIGALSEAFEGIIYFKCNECDFRYEFAITGNRQEAVNIAKLYVCIKCGSHNVTVVKVKADKLGDIPSNTEYIIGGKGFPKVDLSKGLGSLKLPESDIFKIKP